jgi:uncharacterized repeat protein (TIGR04052 family)
MTAPIRPLAPRIAARIARCVGRPSGRGVARVLGPRARATAARARLAPSAALVAAALAGAGALGGCAAGERTVEIQVRAEVNGRPLACGTTFSGIGTTQSTWEALEAKLYIHDPVLLREDGTAEPVVLDQDGRWQRDRFALLDFDDSTGACAPGDADTNLAIRGTVADEDYAGLRFEIGVPVESNHLDAATAPAPLNQPGMWWSWRGGYKFMRFDGKTRGNAAYYLHLGASDCTGSVTEGFSCAAGNRPIVTLDGFSANRSAVTFDLAQVWAQVDLDRQIDRRTDFVQGCMSSAMDPECPTVLGALGLALDGTVTSTPPVFQVGSR